MQAIKIYKNNKEDSKLSIKNSIGKEIMKTPYILKRKPLSQSPRRYIKIPELSISDGDTEEAHFKPYVLVNNTRPRYDLTRISSIYNLKIKS